MQNLKLKEALTYEREGKLGEALNALCEVSRNPFYDSLSSITKMNKERLFKKVMDTAGLDSMSIVPVYESRDTPSNFENESDKAVQKPLVTLTTISTRLDRVYKTIETLNNQTLQPHSINIYISSEPYLIDEGISPDNPELKKIADIGANIYTVDNIGPYRKQYPLIKQLRHAGAKPNTPFITVDDDVLYPENIVEQLMHQLNETDTVVAHRGRCITYKDKWFDNYKAFSVPSELVSIFNMGTGRNGIAYRLGFFPTKPEAFAGHIVAPTADDLWCKYVTSAYCVETSILQPKAATDVTLDFKDTSTSDKRGLFHKYNAKGRNDIAMCALEEYFSHISSGMVSLAGLV